MKEPTCKMKPEERRQLYDEIQSGAVLLKDLSAAQLRDFRCDMDLDYNPSEEFFRKIGNELHRRMDTKHIMKKVNSRFFK